VKRGARRFESACQLPGVEQVGFENPNGQKVLVITNSGVGKTVTLKQANKAAEIALSADSVSTLSWR